jgi:glutathione S-transferase
MKLYFHPISTTCRPITLFAADHGIALDYQVVDLFAGEQTQPAYHAINPNQAVPVLEDGDFRLTESSAILKYLADQIGSAAYPSDLRQRARVNERMDWFNTSLSRDLVYNFLYPQVLPNHRRGDESQQRQFLAWGREKSTQWLTVLDQSWIGANRYVCGNDITLADYLGISQITLGETAHVDFSRWPNISRWVARMKDRPNWDKVNEAFYTNFVRPYAGATFEKL